MTDATVFVELTKAGTMGTDDEYVSVNPRLVVAFESGYVHLGGHGVSVKEDYDEILHRFAMALGYVRASVSHTGEEGSGT